MVHFDNINIIFRDNVQMLQCQTSHTFVKLMGKIKTNVETFPTRTVLRRCRR
jgi:hypothetical protein